MTGGKNLIAVRTELVLEHLVEQLFGTALARRGDELPTALGETHELVVGEQGAPEAASLAGELAKIGYLARVAETELFERARAATPGLADDLREQSGDVVALAAKLARAEPQEKPAPDDGRSASWRVPGPGGHVRHFLALRAAQELLPDEDARRRAAGLQEVGTLKRCFLFGFYVRCCEETATTR